jgi:WD repeat-containing protein 48
VGAICLLNSSHGAGRTYITDQGGLAPGIPLLIAEEHAHGWAIAYHGTVASAGAAGDVATLEDAMPTWLLEYLLLGRAPQVAVVKIQFALLPGEEQLPELVNP